jgi:hypothetical protein
VRRVRAGFRQHHIDQADYEQLLAWQDGRCLCGDPIDVDKGEVDHDHEHCRPPGSCGACVRGILHHGCNFRLGLYERTGKVGRNCPPGWTEKADGYLAAYAARGPYRRLDQRTMAEKLADAKRGVPRPPHVIAAWSRAGCAANVAANKGRPNGRSAWNRGVPMTESARVRLSESRKALFAERREHAK